MVKKYEQIHKKNFKNHIKADVIILGCSLPGIVTAHNFKKKFGDTVDIVVLDLATNTGRAAGGHKTGISVAFQDLPDDIEDDTETPPTPQLKPPPSHVYDNVARFFLEKYSADFNIPAPDSLERSHISSTHKLFQHINGTTVNSVQNYHEFDYLSSVQRWELVQYQNLLDESMHNLFQANAVNTEAERQRLLYFDHTTMEEHICKGLYYTTSRDIMRTIVELVCGTSADKLSVLFYLHQCYRVSSSKNLIDGDNARFREKLLGHFRKRLAHKLQQSVADITVSTKPIKEIRTSPDEQVILEPVIGETDYICSLLAMALRPDQLHDIVMETKLMTEKEIEITSSMEKSKATKFIIEYEENFWQPLGYSGDILSIRGPIIWATERPTITKTRSSDKYAALVGYLKVCEDSESSKEEVLEQLVNLFGKQAANPVSYNEIPIKEVFVPRIGDYIAFRKLTTESSPKFLEWGTLDIFADGDIAAALEAGHSAYVHLLSVLRPQAVTYDDIATGVSPITLYSPLEALTASINIFSTSKIIAACGIALVMVIGIYRGAFRR